LVAVTVTPGIKAPDASDAVPPSVAFVVCENVVGIKRRQSNAAAAADEAFM
jgi:hypothetical protein